MPERAGDIKGSKQNAYSTAVPENQGKEERRKDRFTRTPRGYEELKAKIQGNEMQ